MRTFCGTPASAGIAIGPVFLYKPKIVEILERSINDPDAEWARLTSAINRVTAQLENYYEEAVSQTGEDTAAIFTAQIEMLSDPELMDAVRAAIYRERVNAEFALHQSGEAFARSLEEMEDELFRQRSADVRDVVQRAIQVLSDIDNSHLFASFTTPSIILAPDLTPADTIHLDKSLVLGFCTASGGSTSHTAILARALGLPAIVGAGLEILTLAPGTLVALDGTKGEMIAEPDAQTMGLYNASRKKAEELREAALGKAHEPAVTRDGFQVEVVANVGSVEESKSAIEHGAEGVGLLRTEFVYLGKDHLPSEEEQYQVYWSILEVFGQLPVVLRTLDSGGDKELPYLMFDPERNPFLGVRAIRLCLQHPELFRTQLRAVLRAGVGHNLRVMFPMIATVQELREARRILKECEEELRAEGQPLPDKLQVGIMIEIPSAVMLADHLAKEVDFFSIGTNDLTQYTMAADRTNPGVEYLSDALSPAVLRMLARTIEEGHKAGIWVGICGELAGDPIAIPVLLGLGIDEFSMNGPSIPLAKHIIRELSRAECQSLAQTALNLCDAEELRRLIERQAPVVKAL